LYNKPQGCSTSVALATGPNDDEEEEVCVGMSTQVTAKTCKAEQQSASRFESSTMLRHVGW